MKKICVYLLCIVVVSACWTKRVQQFDYLPLADFGNDTMRIESGTPVRLLAFSGSRDNDKETIYYSQIIAVNMRNGDTLCILCPALMCPSVEGIADQLMVMPNQFDPEKDVYEAKYRRPDRNTLLMIQFSGDVLGVETDNKLYNIEKYLDDSIVKQQLVAINRSIPIFSNKYPTLVGTLSFASNIQK